MAQGFVIQNNLLESTPAGPDANAIDNLGGTGVSNDFLLFDGNKKFVSRLYRYEFDVINASDTTVVDSVTNQFTVLVKAEGRVAFANKSKIALVNGSGTPSYDWEVFNSNGIDRFQVKAKNTTTQIDISGYDYIQRQDIVTHDNLKFVSVKRIPTNLSDSGVGVTQTSDPLNANTLKTNINNAESLLLSLPVKKTRLMLGYESAVFDDPVKFLGPITITNTAAETVTTTAGPGIFMVDSAGGTKKSFIDVTKEPWQVSGDFTVTTDNFAEITDLEFNPGNKLLVEDTTATLDIKATTESHLSVADTTRALIDFTHKMPISVNGEEYYLLMKST